MPDDLSINGFNCATKEIKQAIQKEGLTKGELKLLDKNNDKIISEDELVDMQVEDDEETDKTSSDKKSDDYSKDPTIASLEKQKEKEEEEKMRLDYRLSRLRSQRSEAKSRLDCYKEDSKAFERAQEAVDRIQSEIDSINSKITNCLNNIASLSIKITTAIDNFEAQKQAEAEAMNKSANNAAIVQASNNTTGANNVSSTNNVSDVNAASNINAQKGSGTKLASVTGELSVCLDNVAKSLGKSRQEAADYITTLCSTVGKGYFDPKIILSQVFSESSGNQSVTTTATSAFVGLGQMSSVAVQEVNRQFGTNFSFSDMDNPAKNLEAMVYLMRFQYERYGHNLGAAITAYNVGHYSGTVNGYAQKIMSRAA